MTKINKYQDPLIDIVISQKDSHPIAKAICSNKRVDAMSDKILEEGLYNEVVLMAMDSGSVIKKEDAVYMARRLKEIIKEKYKFLHTQEIQWALRQAIAGRYGDIYGVSVKTCLNILLKYMEERRNYIAKRVKQRDIERIKEEEEAWKNKKLASKVKKIKTRSA